MSVKRVFDYKLGRAVWHVTKPSDTGKQHYYGYSLNEAFSGGFLK